jgi:hypothetical protein
MANALMAKRILRAIEANPYNFDMAFWVSIPWASWEETDYATWNGEEDEEGEDSFALTPLFIEAVNTDAAELPKEIGNVCGTTLCIAGWALALDGWELTRNDDEAFKKGEEFRGFFATGAEILDISTGEAERLFTLNDENAIIILTQIAEGEEINWTAVGYTEAIVYED